MRATIPRRPREWVEGSLEKKGEAVRAREENWILSRRVFWKVWSHLLEAAPAIM